MTSIEDLTATIIAELHRQAKSSGCTTEDNGRLVQIDGSFDAQRLAAAITEALSRPADDTQMAHEKP